MSLDESAGRYAILILLVMSKRARRAVFDALRQIGEL